MRSQRSPFLKIGYVVPANLLFGGKISSFSRGAYRSPADLSFSALILNPFCVCVEVLYGIQRSVALRQSNLTITPNAVQEIERWGKRGGAEGAAHAAPTYGDRRLNVTVIPLIQEYMRHRQ